MTPGDTYTITVGGQGASGQAGGAGGFNGGAAGAPGFHTSDWNGHGGGGGGATDVRHGGTAAGDRILVAGGGGGDGGPGIPEDIHPPQRGGIGGGVTGASNGSRDPGGGGFGWGGTGTAGGAGGLFQYGTTTSYDGASGTLAAGGNGGTGGPGAGGGGGGGGLYGGGGGSGSDNTNVPASGGGGGSGYAVAAATDVGLAYPAIGSDGSAAISYGVPYAPTVDAPALVDTLNQPITFQYTVDGLPAPKLTVQGLPPGLTLDQSGVLSGTPTAAGLYSIAITATNDVGSTRVDSQISVSDPNQSLIQSVSTTVSGTPGAAQLGLQYSYVFAISGSPLPQCSAPTGDLPPGLALDADSCTLSGTPTQVGTYTFTVTADNGGATPGAGTFTVAVQEPASISGTPPQNLTTGEALTFEYTLGGSPHPQTSVSPASLPPGLLLVDGTLSGTPTTPGTYTWTVIAHNGVGDDAGVTSTAVVADPTPTAVAPKVSITGTSVAEGNSGTRNVTLRVTLDAPSSTPVTVRWNTANGTATAGSDYVAASGTVTFQPGETAKTIIVRVKGDRVKEPYETFTVHLHNATHATIGHGTATVGIRNDD